MIKIINLKINGLDEDVTIDQNSFLVTFALESSKNDDAFKYKILFNNRAYEGKENTLRIVDNTLKPFSSYVLVLEIESKYKEKDSHTITIHTGKMSESFSAHWISDPLYKFTAKKISPEVLSFKKEINITKPIKSAIIYASAIGVYNLYLNNQKVNNQYLLPGFTSYRHQIEYQRFDITKQLQKDNIIEFLVAGGWAVGSFVFTRKNRITAKKQALLAELHIEYADGTKKIIGTDCSWLSSHITQYDSVDLYDGEIFDATFKHLDNHYHNAALAKLSFKPNLLAHYSTYNRIVKRLDAELIYKTPKLIFDFKQNHAGILTLKIKNAQEGQIIKIKHAEILNEKHDLNTAFLRGAKQEIIYKCKKGTQTFTPTFVYMGFRYVSIEGISEKDIEIFSNVLSSDMANEGSFVTSDKLINRLQENIKWSSLSNFVEIPTDCPQRSERMGWTGDIALFAQTALFNFEASAFLKKWLKDLRSEQLKSGGIPNTIPHQGYGFPTTMPSMAIDFWGDAALLVPYAIYEFTGDKEILKTSYNSMKKYVNAELFWAKFLSFGKHRYIWHTLSTFHFGDWVTPDINKMSAWQKRSIYTATCSLYNCASLLSKIAAILDYQDDQNKYDLLSKRVSKAFNTILTDGQGKLKSEFQTGYVLPIYYGMFDKETKRLATDNLCTLIKKNDYKIGTGFPGTPYILFALFDNDKKEEALKMLFNDKCPSWLYEVKVGATTIWERWDGLDENGNCPIQEDGTGGMISYNHYASGAVGDFLYKRIAGIIPLEAGYSKVLFKPYINKKYFTSLSASTMTKNGKTGISYLIKDNKININIVVPIGSKATLEIQNKKYEFGNGTHTLSFELINQ